MLNNVFKKNKKKSEMKDLFTSNLDQVCSEIRKHYLFVNMLESAISWLVLRGLDTNPVGKNV